MNELQSNVKAFSSFRVLNEEASHDERDMLFRNMAQLFVFVSERCDDEQVAQYDKVLCQLADLVEEKARIHVADLLARLDRAPGTVVVKLAHDNIAVARPLLEFSSVLSDDDLIDIVRQTDEDHRVLIAERENLGGRVGDAIVDLGGVQSTRSLVNNKSAEIAGATAVKLLERASQDEVLAKSLRGRADIDWGSLRASISAAGARVLEQLGLGEKLGGADSLGAVGTVVYNRIRNRAGFSAKEWKLAWNQVKALADRSQLDGNALVRFARFGYGHHTAAAMTMLLKVPPEVLLKWLAAQDYVAVSIAARAFGLNEDLFETIVGVLPWRDHPQSHDLKRVRNRFEALSRVEASEIFDLWRSHSFRKGSWTPEKQVVSMN